MAGVLPLTIVSGSQRELASGDYLANSPYPGYISGLGLKWISNTSVSIGPGAAEIESTGRAIKLDSELEKNGLSLSANTQYHLYLYDNFGTTDVEITTTAPSTPYSGTAASKSGVTSKRYIGGIRTDGSGNVRPFQHFHNSGVYIWRLSESGTIWTRMLNGGSATTATSISCLSASLSVANALLCFVTAPVVGGVRIASADDTLSSTSSQLPLGSGSKVEALLSCSSSQQIQYLNSSASQQTYVDVFGFILDR